MMLWQPRENVDGLAGLLSNGKNVSRRIAGSLNLGNLGVRKIAAYQNERRRDIVEIKPA